MTEPRRTYVTPRWRLVARAWLGTVIGSLALATFVCGLSGFSWQYVDSTNAEAEALNRKDGNANPPRRDWSIPLFKTVQLFLLNSGSEDDAEHPSNWLLTIARSAAAALFLVVSSTVILRVLDDVRRLPSQLTRKKHVVICGLGQIGLQLLDDLESQGRARNVVVIENNPAHPWLEYARSRGAAIVLGDSSKANVLLEARAPHASEVFVVNGDDGVNLEVAAELGMLLAERANHESRLRLYVHIVDTGFAAALGPYCKALHDTPKMRVQAFNVPRIAAARLVVNQLWPHAPKEPNEAAHFAIVGFGAMGQALAVQLAELAHFPNCKRSRFTIADGDIERVGAAFLARFPRFTSWTDEVIGVTEFTAEADEWNWNCHPLPAEFKVAGDEAIQYVCNAEFVEQPSARGDERFAQRLAKRFDVPGVKPFVFICGQQDRENFETAVHLRDTLACLGRSDVPIFVWLPRQPALAETLSRTKGGKFFPFGECRAAASYSEITAPIRESLGQRIHEDYEKHVLRAGIRRDKHSWAELRDDFRESNRMAADHLIIKLATVGLQIRRSNAPAKPPAELRSVDEPQIKRLAQMEHYRWVAERLLAGWRYAAKGKTAQEIEENKRRKLNHDLAPWDKLEAEQQKDFNQINAVLRECQNDGFCVEPLANKAD